MEPGAAERAELSRRLRPFPWKVVETGSSAAALHAAHLAQHAGCVVLARFEPGATAPRELGRRLAAFAPGSNFLVFLVARQDAAHLSAAYAAGAADVLATPPEHAELGPRIDSAFHVLDLEQFRASIADNSSLIADMSTSSIVHGRFYLENELNNEIRRATRYDHPLALILVEVSMKYTSAEGAIRASGRYLSDQMRQGIDWIARYNRESFVLVLPETGVEDSHAAATRVASKVRTRDSTVNGIPCDAVWTFGFTGFDHVGTGPPEAETLLASAQNYLAAARLKSSHRIAGGAFTR